MKKYIFSSAIGISVIALMIGLWSYSQAASEGTISICVGKNGLVYILGTGFRRENCRNNESLLTWNAQGVQGPKGDKGDKGDTGQQGPQGPAGNNAQVLHLADNNGQDLGILIDSQMIYIESLDAVLKLDSDFSSIIVTNRYRLYFDEPNCSGGVFIGRPQLNSIYTNLDNHPKYYMADRDDIATTRISKSWNERSTDCENTETSISNSVFLNEVTFPFTLPLASPLRVVGQ